MIDETANSGEQPGAAPAESAGQTGAEERVAFCQQCGRGLTSSTIRRAGAAVYCEPCLVARLEGAAPGSTASGASGAASPGGAAGWTPVGSAASQNATGATGTGAAPTGSAYVPPQVVSGEPSPWLAALLGLIPGVGAMYNGQYAKGVAHLVIFVVLDSLQHSVNDIFGLFVLGWVFYQVFDAYHTAKARREGTPLPNPFGLNDIGDRMGFGKNWPGSASRPVTTASSAGWAPSSRTATPPPPANPNWAGYVPPTSFGAAAPPPPSATVSAPPPSAAWSAPPYGATYTGEPGGMPGSMPVPPANASVVPIPVRRFPVGAAWLIGLGLFFLLANLDPAWHLSASWVAAILLAAVGTWVLFRRVEMLRSVARLSGEPEALGTDGLRRLACQVRGPVVVLVLAALFALQAVGAWTLGQTWPALFIVFGALLLLERVAGQRQWYPVHDASGAAANPGASAPRATWSAGESEPRKDGR